MIPMAEENKFSITIVILKICSQSVQKKFKMAKSVSKTVMADVFSPRGRDGRKEVIGDDVRHPAVIL